MNKHANRVTGNAALDTTCSHGYAIRRDKCDEGQPENGREQSSNGPDLDRRRSDRIICDDQHISGFAQLLAVIRRNVVKIFSRSAHDQHTYDGPHRFIRVGNSRRPVEPLTTGKGNPRETQNILISNAAMLALWVVLLTLIVEVTNR